MLRSIASENAKDRSEGADVAVDLLNEYSDAEVFTLTFALVCSYEIETDAAAQEAQLRALAEFLEHGVAPEFMIRRAAAAGKAPLSVSAREHVEYLETVFDEA